MKKASFRSFLLPIGMACFLLAVLASLGNILFFPYARGLYSMTAPRYMIFYIAFFFLLLAVSRFLKLADTTALERCASRLVPAVLIFSSSLMLICGFCLAHRPFCDNSFVFLGARMLSGYGKISPELDDYIYKYLLHFPNQWGFVLLLSLFPYKWFTTDLILYVLSAIQTLLFSTSFFSLLSAVRKRFGVRAQLMFLLSLLLFLPQYPAAAVLYTDTFSMPFVLFALSCMLRIDQNTPRKQVILLSIGCGLSILIGSMIKMTCLILFFAAVIVWLLTLHPKRAAVCITIPLLIFSCGTGTFNHHMANHVFNPDDAARYKTPLLHWVMMSIPTENNRYGRNTADYDYTWSLMDQGSSQEEIMQSIYDRMGERLATYRSPKDVIYALICKNANYAGDGTFGMWEMLDDAPLRENLLSSIFLYYGPYYPLYADLCGGIWLAHLTMAALSCLQDMKKRRFSLSLPMIAFLGLMIFEFIWEARSRYLFNFAPVLLLISACGAAQCSKPAKPDSIADHP